MESKKKNESFIKIIILTIVFLLSTNVINAQITYMPPGTHVNYSESTTLKNYQNKKLNSFNDKYDFLWLGSATDVTNTCGITENATSKKALTSNCYFMFKGLSYKTYKFDLKLNFFDINNVMMAYGTVNDFFDGHSNLTFGPSGENFKLSYNVELFYAGTSTKVSFDAFPYYLGLYDPDHTDVKSSDMSEWYWIDNAKSKYQDNDNYPTFTFEDAYALQNGWFKNQTFTYPDGTTMLFDISDAPNGDGNALIFKGNSTIQNQATFSHDTGFASDIAYILIDSKIQRAKINYYDTTSGTNVLLESEVVSGPSDTTIDYSTADIIRKYQLQGYSLVQDNFPANAKFDTNLNVDQEFNVYLNQNGKAVVHFIDIDNDNTLLKTRAEVQGKAGTIISDPSYTDDITYYENRGYELFEDGMLNPGNYVSGQTKEIYVKLKHTYTEISKDIYEKDKCLNTSCTAKIAECAN